jgi:hypothetical protein
VSDRRLADLVSVELHGVEEPGHDFAVGVQVRAENAVGVALRLDDGAGLRWMLAPGQRNELLARGTGSAADDELVDGSPHAEERT